jgi:bifunctional UDP-N-acetylglucosamine pyrophosphorylase/glucosamine-1-phosphate N-acetyltransferase
MTARSSLTVVLAAGEGTRMRSALPKVLHPVASQSLLAHVLDAAPHGAGAALAVVVGPNHKAVSDEVRRIRPDAATFIQAERLGTAHAVLAAREAIARGADDLLVAFGDTPLISAETFARMRAPLAKGAALTVLGFRAADPAGYGRLLLEGDHLVAIREHADATPEERKVTLCNAGVMAFDGRRALEIIDAGVTLTAPETVFLSADTTFGSDVTIEPFVVIGPGVSIGDGTVIHSFSHIVQSSIGKNVQIGPYARMRPGTSMGDGSKLGNFVETKAAIIEAGAKVNHLSYVGDAHVGAKANLGAGTITCNYDGFAKNKTIIGAGAFIGTNTSLVAPVKIGTGAYIGSGSVITRDVPDDAMAVERSPQSIREGGAVRYRELKTRGKKPKEG